MNGRNNEKYFSFLITVSFFLFSVIYKRESIQNTRFLTQKKALITGTKRKEPFSDDSFSQFVS